MESRDSKLEKKTETLSSPSYLQQTFSTVKKAGNYAAEVILGDLWKATGRDGKGVATIVERAAEQSKRSPNKTSSLRFFYKTVHYIHPKYIGALLQNEDKIYGHNVSNLFKTIFGDGVEGDNIFAIPSDHPNYRPLRTDFQLHLFTGNALKKLMIPMNTVANEYLAEIDSEDGKIQDVEKLSALFALEMIARTQLGLTNFPKKSEEKSSDSEEKLPNKVKFSDMEKVLQIIDEITVKMANPIYSAPGLIGKGIELIDKYVLGEKTLAELLAPTQKILINLIEQNEDSIFSTDNWVKNVSMERERKRRNISDKDWAQALKERSPLAKDVLYSHAVRYAISLFFVVGHETSAKFIYSALTFLSDENHQHIVRKLHDELAEYLKRTGKTVDQLTREDLSELVYLTAVMQETLRLRPPIPIMAGMFSEGFEIDSMGRVKKDDPFIISILEIHQNQDVYGRNAAEFDPDRWINEDGTLKQFPRDAFLPFGFKRRECVGQNFVLQEAKILLTKLLQKYSFQIEGPDPKRYKEVVPIISLKPTHKVSIKGTKREEPEPPRSVMR
jgi:cytochrome P450